MQHQLEKYDRKKLSYVAASFTITSYAYMKVLFMKIVVDGIPINVTKKKIRNMYIRIKAGGIVNASVPLYASHDGICEFLYSKADWIRKYVQLEKQNSAPSLPTAVPGEHMHIFGKEYELIVSIGYKQKSFKLYPELGKAVLKVASGTSVAEGRKVIKEALRSELKRIVMQRMPYIEHYAGLKCSRWHIRHMKSRWGSCNVRTKVIYLNLRLATKPIKCIDYIIIHELIHTVIADHGSEFKRMRDKLVPNWKELDDILCKAEYVGDIPEIHHPEYTVYE